MPRYMVILFDNDETFYVDANLECRQMASLIFTDNSGEIIKVLAPGTWKEATRVNEPR